MEVKLKIVRCIKRTYHHRCNGHRCKGLYWLESQSSIRQQRGSCGLLPGQLTSASAFTAGAKCYKRTHPKQGKCGVPHYIMERSNFWQFRKDLGLMWEPISGKWIAIVVSQPGGTKEGNSETFFFSCCVTLHLWSDRRMRSFILYTSEILLSWSWSVSVIFILFGVLILLKCKFHLL